MRYYIAYKFQGSDKEKLIKNLNLISSKIKEAGHSPYIFYQKNLDWGNIQMSSRDIINSAFLEVEKSDVFFAFVDSEEKSEGMLLESGYAKALNKKIVLAIKKDVNLRFLRNMADVVIEFDEFSNLIDVIKSNLI